MTRVSAEQFQACINDQFQVESTLVNCHQLSLHISHASQLISVLAQIGKEHLLFTGAIFDELEYLNEFGIHYATPKQVKQFTEEFSSITVDDLHFLCQQCPVFCTIDNLLNIFQKIKAYYLLASQQGEAIITYTV